MKRYILKSLSMLCIAASVVSCGSGGDDDGGDPPTPSFESESITVLIPAKADEVGDGDTATFEWSSSDKISLQYQQSSGSSYTTTLFSSQGSGAGVNFSGSVWSWEETKSLYAIYNRSTAQDSRTITSNSVVVSQSDFTSVTTPSFADSNSVSARDMGFMVAMVSGAEASSSDDYSISDLNFKQVASYMQLYFKGTQTENSKVTSFELAPTTGQNNLFVSSAEVAMSTGVITSASEYLYSITREVEGGDATSGKFLTVPMFPVDIAEELTLKLSVEGIGDRVGWSWNYTYTIPTINFKRNSIAQFELDWGSLVETVLVSVATADDLSDMAASGQTPEGDNWVISCDETNTQETIDNLSSVLSNNSVEAGSVTVELPTVTTLPANSFSSTDTSSNAALGTVTLANVTEVGEAAFMGNTSVKEVTLGSDESDVTLAESVFEGCTSLETCNVKTSELPKSVFKGCSSLKSVDLESVKTIGESSFEGCTSLFAETAQAVSMFTTRAVADTELVLSAVTKIDARAFFNCTQFNVLRLNEGSEVILESIAADAFAADAISSFTSQMTLYIAGAMSSYVDTKSNTLTLGGVSLAFNNIFVDGVDPYVEDDDDDVDDEKSDAGTGTGEDANVETI